MRNDLTDLTVVLDRSGSMESCRGDAEGGLNALVRKQCEQPGTCLFTLVQFDTIYEFVHTAVPIQDVPKCTLEPRGSTALLDAVGRAIVETGERLKKMDEAERPGLVVFVIITDGQENSSVEFSKAKVKEMIERQQNVYKWQFTFLGANQDAFAEAGGIGILSVGTANYSKADAAFLGTSGKISRMRQAAASGSEVDNSYSKNELDEMK